MTEREREDAPVGCRCRAGLASGLAGLTAVDVHGRSPQTPLHSNVVFQGSSADGSVFATLQIVMGAINRLFTHFDWVLLG